MFNKNKITSFIKNIQNNKKPTLIKFIYALDIPGIGEDIAKNLAIYFETYKDMIIYFNSMSKRNNRELIVEVGGIGEIIEQKLHDWFDNFDNVTLLKQLKILGIEPQDHVNTLFGV